LKQNKGIVTLPTCIISLFLGIAVFLGIIMAVISSGSNPVQEPADALAQLTIIPAPTLTPTSPVVYEEPNLEVRYVSPEGFSIGAYVTIEKTQGAGLKIRPNPGTGGETSFIAMDGDLFVIIDGPDERNGYSWWKLQGFEDKSLVGWGASDYFSLIAPAADQTVQEGQANGS